MQVLPLTLEVKMNIPDELAQQKVTYRQCRSGRQLFKSYEKHEIIGAAVNSGMLSSPVRRYAKWEKDKFRDEVGRNNYQFSDVAPRNMYKNWEGKLCLPHLHYMKLDPKALSGAQKTGDCVSWAVRNAIDASRSFEIGELKESEDYILRQATALLYSTRGHNSAGASPTRIAYASKKVGILLEKEIESPSGEVWDFQDYNKYYRLGMKYGKTGMPQWIIDITSKNAPKHVAEINTKEELLTALTNGYAVACGSMLGVSNKTGKDGVPFLSWKSGSWSHEMKISGYDATRKYHKDILIIWSNSWGGGWRSMKGWPTKDYGPMPQSAFVLTLSDTMRYAIEPGEAHAFSDVDGFKRRRMPDLGAGGVV